jgi:hypothetical protein
MSGEPMTAEPEEVSHETSGEPFVTPVAGNGENAEADIHSQAIVTPQVPVPMTKKPISFKSNKNAEAGAASFSIPKFNEYGDVITG